MAIREKLRAKFSSKNKSSSSPPLSEAATESHYTGRTDIEYYKPHEIPKSKYRGRVDKNHQEKLDSYCFEDAFTVARRPSAALSGTFSPGGTKAFSRRTSYVSNLGAQTPARSRRSSLSSDANDSFSIPSSRMTPSEPAENTADEIDQTNTGFTKMNTFKNATGNVPVIRLNAGKDNDLSNNHIEHSQPSPELPFTAEELTQAMTRATITPPPTTGRRTSVFVS